MVLTRRINRVACINSLKSGRQHREAHATRNISCVLRLYSLSIINLLVSSILVLSMVQAESTPFLWPNTTAILPSKNVNSSRINSTNLAELCLNSDFTTVNYTAENQWFSNQVDSCNNLVWKDVIPPGKVMVGTNSTERSIDCSVFREISTILQYVKNQSGIFNSVIERYDCNESYSVKKTCSACLVS